MTEVNAEKRLVNRFYQFLLFTFNLFVFEVMTECRYVNAVFVAGIGMKGEMIIIQNVSRYCDDIYECVADNGVPPAQSRQMRVTVECKKHLFLVQSQ